MRIRTELEEPTACDHCGDSAVMYSANQTTIHNPNKRFGLWKCLARDCGAMVTTPFGSRRPHGVMAPREVRKLRMELHVVFDKLWNQHHSLWSRDEAYEWLGIALEVPMDECNISRLSAENLQIAIGLATDKFREHMRIHIRRDAKKAKRYRRQEESKNKRNSTEKAVRVGSKWRNPMNNGRKLLRYKAQDDN